MRVVYDASVLGMSTLDPKARTGVFRVVEELAVGLVESDQCEVGFCAGGDSFLPVYGTSRYLAEHRVLRRAPFLSGGPLSLARSGLLDLCAAGLAAEGQGALASARRRVARRIRDGLLRGASPISGRVVAGADIFHSPHAPLPDLSVAGVRRFLTVYDLVGLLRPELFEPHVERYVSRIVRSIRPDDWVTCISESTKNDLCEYAGIAPERVFVTPLAASRELFHRDVDEAEAAAVRRKYGIPDAPYLLSLNTVEPRKNLDRAIRAFAAAAAEGADLYFVLVGGLGWKYGPVLEAVQKAAGARGRVIFTGYVPDGDLAALYGGAIAFLYPSLWEGFGLPVLEAMQCGVPVITSDNSSLPEIVGDAGIMVGATDEAALTEAILRIDRDSEWRRELAARAVARAAGFSWERTVSETLAAYRASLAA